MRRTFAEAPSPVTMSGSTAAFHSTERYMAITAAEFDGLEQTIQSGGVASALDELVKQLVSRKSYRELFEARKMQVRHRLGLPPLYGDAPEQLDPSVRDKLEDGLIAACREVGMLLLEAGAVREGWMYMRPVGEKETVATILRKIEVTDENIDELIEVALSEGVDTALGYQLMLDHYGTCNSITTFDTELSHRGKGEQQTAARLLLRHLRDGLCHSLKSDIARQEGSEPSETTVAELIDDRDWLFLDNAYHIDTTHLASTVRFSRILDDEDSLRIALDLIEYGKRLSSPFQYQGDEPFADIYAAYGLYFQALLGHDVDEAVTYFREKAESLEINEHGTAAVEVYVDLLARLKRPQVALDEFLRLIPDESQTLGIAPTLLELARQAENYQPLLSHCRQRDDLLGFATVLVHARISNR